MADALTIVRLAPGWEQPSLRTELMALPQRLADQTDGVIYRGRNTLTRLSIGDHEVVVKAFPSPRTVIKRIQRVGRDSKAVRAYDHAARMRELGIGTPEPFAALEADDGRAWYLCAWVADCTTLRDMSRQTGPESDHVAQLAGAFVGRMHQVGAYHFDSTPGNILMRREGDVAAFEVVDCNRMRFGRVGVWAGLRSLVQLDRHGRLLESYCAARGWNADRIRWMYHLRLSLEHWSRKLKNLTRPWRRKLGV